MASMLPSDIILQVVDSFAPPSGRTCPIAIPPKHPTTRTLLSLTRTCRIAYSTATRLVFEQCLWIDSFCRLERVLYTLEQLNARLDRDPDANGTNSLGLPPVAIRRHIQSLYLDPFANGSLADFPTISLLCKLILQLAPHLRRLVIDLPLRDYNESQEVERYRPILGQAFAQLTSLEIFCSARDELLMRAFSRASDVNRENSEPPIWSHWPSLKTLALYNADVSWQFWPYVGQLKDLENLVLTRADGADEVDTVRSWKEHRHKDSSSLTVVFVNVEAQHRPLMESCRWRANDDIVVLKAYVPISYYSDENIILICQDWTKKKFLRGEYEEIHGEIVVGPDGG